MFYGVQKNGFMVEAFAGSGFVILYWLMELPLPFTLNVFYREKKAFALRIIAWNSNAEPSTIL